MDSKVFGQFIASVRKEKNMTQADLAKRIGVTDKAISRWERGIGFPDINTLEPLANALEISVLELMRSEKADMEQKDYRLSEGEVTEMMHHAVEMEKENRGQDGKIRYTKKSKCAYTVNSLFSYNNPIK